ncbi:reactive intermediate/imine deaminase [bacterium]|nr:reactive intermediate/imine deaminase [bacterium]
MLRKIVQTGAAPAAVGPYSQAVQSGDFLYSAGQVPLDPATGKLVPGDIGAQTHQVMKNLAAILAAAGAGFGDVVKTTCFLADMADFAAFNAVYAEYFAGVAPPARSTVAVAGLPLGARVEVELVARLPG